MALADKLLRLVPSRLRDFLHRHRRHLPTAALIAGFIWDSITIGRPDQLFENVVLLFYLALSGCGILLLSYRREKKASVPVGLPILIQFAFGNLASALFILYGISGTIAGNWLFLLLFVTLLVGNEFIRERYGVLRFNVSVYYLLLFSYLMLVVPILLREVGPSGFLVAGFASIALIVIFLRVIRFTAPSVFAEHRRQLFMMIAAVYIGFHVLYIFNLIPPVPLATKEMGIYHRVERVSHAAGIDRYIVSYEEGPWYQFWKRSDDVFHFAPGERAYCFSSVFAPAGINTSILHRWEYYDEASDSWKTATRVPFSVVGGRDEGYRGYSTKTALSDGAWRCSVETERGALIGRRSFEVVSVPQVPALKTRFE